jgi:DNA-binding NtrC family response regulator/tetratricopeptide (TPR) repeat protein
MAELQDRRRVASGASEIPSRTEFLNLLALAGGQFDADNRHEALSLYLKALAAAPGIAEPHETVFLERRVGECFQLRAEYDQALVHLNQAERLLGSNPDDLELAQVLAIRGSICTDQARFSHAQRLLKRSHDLLKHRSDHKAFGQLERRLGKLYLRMGRPQEARTWFESALATYRRIDDQRGIAGTLNNLGLIHKLSCEWVEAIRVMEKGLALNEILADESQIGALCVNLGVVHLKLGQWQRSEERLDRAVISMARTGNRRGLANARIGQANLATRRRQWHEAEMHLAEALDIAQQHDLMRTECLCYESLGDLEIDRGRLDQAEKHLRHGLKQARERTSAGELVGELGRRLGAVLTQRGELTEALTLAEEAIQIDRKVGDVYEEALCHGLLARIAGLKCDAESMDRHAKQAFDRLSHFGERFEQARLWMALGDVLVTKRGELRSNWLEEARTAYQRAETLFMALNLPGYVAMAALRLAQLEQAHGRLDQALTRLENTLGLLPAEEAELRGELDRLRASVEDAMARGYGSTAAEREAFEEVTKLYNGGVEVGDVLDNLLGLMTQRSSSDRAFFAWGRPGKRLELITASGFKRNTAAQLLAALQTRFLYLIEEQRPLVASDPCGDARLKEIPGDALKNALSISVLPFRITDQIEGLVYMERQRDNQAGPYRSAELALLAVLTNVVAIAAVESERARSLSHATQRSDLPEALASILTRNEEMLHILRLVERVASTPARVMIEGETGTGKGLLARAIHEVSPRAEHPFVQVNCAALPEPLLESELFGHVQGAFTGAVRNKTGLFEETGEGTIFLDEVDKTSITMQGKLLHVLDRQEVRPVGDTKWRTIRCRVICATNVQLRDRIRDGEFLEDLFYRLNEFAVTMPPLRDRPDDIMLLARHFLEASSARMGKRPRGFEPDLEHVLIAHDWPGNVRELEKIIERLVVLSENDVPLSLGSLPENALGGPNRGIRQGATLREEIKRLEARMIGDSLREHGWNKLRTSKSLKISYPSLLKKIREYGLDRRAPARGKTRTNGRASGATGERTKDFLGNL